MFSRPFAGASSAPLNTLLPVLSAAFAALETGFATGSSGVSPSGRSPGTRLSGIGEPAWSAFMASMAWEGTGAELGASSSSGTPNTSTSGPPETSEL